MQKKLSDITRDEWIALHWIEVPQSFDDRTERIFEAIARRTPDEAAQANIDWDETIEAREATKDIEL